MPRSKDFLTFVRTLQVLAGLAILRIFIVGIINATTKLDTNHIEAIIRLVVIVGMLGISPFIYKGRWVKVITTLGWFAVTAIFVYVTFIKL